MPFPIAAFIAQILISLAISVVAYLIMPQPKVEQPDELKDFEIPTAEAGRPIPVVFGDKTIKSPNVIWSGERTTTSVSI